MRKRFSYKRQAASAGALLLTTSSGSCYPLAHQPSSRMGPYASRVTGTSLNSLSRPGLSHTPHALRRKVSPSHDASVLVAGRHA